MSFAPGAWRYAIPAFAAVLPALIFSAAGAVLMAAVGAGVLFFHRDPDRTTPVDGVVSPADGKVSVIREEGDRVRVGVFMNVWDVHVNRAPIGGTVEEVEHVPGANRPAFSKESDRNERVHLRFEDHTVTLVAGAFARRIHPYVEAGDDLDRGERVGHISFGSRADVLLPPEIDREDLAVERGESVTAGETVLARPPGLHRADEDDRVGLIDDREKLADDRNERGAGTASEPSEAGAVESVAEGSRSRNEPTGGPTPDEPAAEDRERPQGIGMARERPAESRDRTDGDGD